MDRHSTKIDFEEFLAALADGRKVAQRRPSMVRGRGYGSGQMRGKSI
jgi:hypothetical protein